MAETASIYQNVGEISNIDQAMQSTVSTMKAFRIGAQDSIKIIDLYNYVGNRFAVTSEDIGLAMQDAGAALASSNNSLSESVALWTAMNEITQDGSKSSTALRTISQRFRNTAGQLQDMGENADGAAESVTKLQQQMKEASGVDIMLNPDTFKSTYQIIKELSAVWENLTDRQQADVTKLASGTRQSATFGALLSNFATAEKVLAQSADVAGSALEEHSRWLEGIEAKQQRATAQFQAFSNAILDSSLVKGYYDASSGILGFLTNIIDTLGTIPTLAAAAAAALSFKNVGISKVKYAPPYSLSMAA